MRLVPLLLFVVLAAPGCSPAPAPTAPIVTGPATPNAAGPLAADLFARVNAYRDSLGLAPLAWHPGAALIAEQHCEDMHARHYFSHVTPDGIDLAGRFAAAGVSYTDAAENLAEGEADAASVLADWLASPEHRATLESTAYTHQGIAVIDRVWTHEFLTPR